ncbi:unnamed protein product [Chrysoparadoxa australica]
MSSLALAALLVRSSLFENKPAKNLEPLAALATKAKYRKGDVLSKEGEIVEKCLVLEEGLLLRHKTNPSTGKTLLVDEIVPGQVSGLLHMMKYGGELTGYATITADADSIVWEIPKKKFSALLEEDADFTRFMLGVLARQVRRDSKTVRLIEARSQATGTTGLLSRKNSGIPSQEVDKPIKVMCYASTKWVKENFLAFQEKFNKKAGFNEKVDMHFSTDLLELGKTFHAVGFTAVCLFVNDECHAEIVRQLSLLGVKLILMRCAGFDHVDVHSCETLGLTCARVPAYSPYAVAEHAIALLMTLNRKINRASSRVREGNFLLDGLSGFDVHGKNVGVMGTGKIGQCLCNILLGFGANLLCFDLFQSQELKDKGATYVSQDEIWSSCDVIFLMMPLLPATRHTLNAAVLPKLKRGVTIINTSRGGLVDTVALLEGLRSGVIGAAGLDVYEKEADFFFKDCSDKPLDDEVLTSLLGMNQVVMTAHQAFFTYALGYLAALIHLCSLCIQHLMFAVSVILNTDCPHFLRLTCTFPTTLPPFTDIHHASTFQARCH